MPKNYREITKGVSAQLAKLRSDIPDTLAAFNALGKAASADGAIDKKTKEFIAVALAVAARCDACVGFHVQAFIRLGGTRQELEEILGMAVYMGGGPSLMYAAEAMDAFDQFSPAPAATA